MEITKKRNIKICTGAESVGGESGDGTKALQSIERNIANLEKSILNSSHRKTDEIYESDAHHQVNGFIHRYLTNRDYYESMVLYASTEGSALHRIAIQPLPHSGPKLHFFVQFYNICRKLN